MFFPTISQYWNSNGSWNLSLWNAGTKVSYLVNAMVADDLVTQTATIFAGMVMTKCTNDNPVSASEELKFPYMHVFPASKIFN